jgi:hypothetical protein
LSRSQAAQRLHRLTPWRPLTFGLKVATDKQTALIIPERRA